MLENQIRLSLTNGRMRAFIFFPGICDCPVQHSKAETISGQGSDAHATFVLRQESRQVVYSEGLWSCWMKLYVNVGHEFRFYLAIFRLLELPQS